MKKPKRYYRGRKPVTVTMEGVFKTVKRIMATGKEEEFLELCRAQGHAVVATPDVVNAVKQHLAENDAHSSDALAASLQRASLESLSAVSDATPTCF